MQSAATWERELVARSSGFEVRGCSSNSAMHVAPGFSPAFLPLQPADLKVGATEARSHGGGVKLPLRTHLVWSHTSPTPHRMRHPRRHSEEPKGDEESAFWSLKKRAGTKSRFFGQEQASE